MIKVSSSKLKIDLGSWEKHQSLFYSVEFEDIKMKYSHRGFEMDKKRSYCFKRHNIIRKYYPELTICS